MTDDKNVLDRVLMQPNQLAIMEKNKLQTTIKDLADTGLSIIPALAGLLTPDLATNPSKVISSVGSAIVASKLGKFCSELKEKREKKQIKENLESAQDSIFDLLKFIEENPDDIKLEAVKKLFFKSIENDATEIEQQTVFLLIQVCKKLSVNDLLVLKAAYEVSKGKFPEEAKKLGFDVNGRHCSMWFKVTAERLGHGMASLVETSESRLIELKLIFPREERDNSTYFPAGNFRLTDLGTKLCEYLAE